ncbi:hypothetical protein BDY24DRAFT_416102 [Mrakia frigida]|uniref:uncharacterized protein n=1 Tax=Mrakia frigida TaxID=29902 RepID=UPI003FCC17F2
MTANAVSLPVLRQLISSSLHLLNLDVGWNLERFEHAFDIVAEAANEVDLPFLAAIRDAVVAGFLREGEADDMEFMVDYLEVVDGEKSLASVGSLLKPDPSPFVNNILQARPLLRFGHLQPYLFTTNGKPRQRLVDLGTYITEHPFGGDEVQAPPSSSSPRRRPSSSSGSSVGRHSAVAPGLPSSSSSSYPPNGSRKSSYLPETEPSHRGTSKRGRDLEDEDQDELSDDELQARIESMVQDQISRPPPTLANLGFDAKRNEMARRTALMALSLCRGQLCGNIKLEVLTRP